MMQSTYDPTNVPVLEKGSGPAVVFLHGAPDHRNEWQEVIDLLHTDYRCLAPDLPGFGNSAAPPATYDYSINAQVAFFDAWVKATLGDEPFLLVAHDIGAIMGMAWASKNPAQVRGLIIMNTVLSADYEWHTLARIWSSPLLGSLFMRTLTRFTYRMAFQRDFPQVQRHQIEAMYDGLTPTTRKGIMRHFSTMTRPDFFKDWEDCLKAVPSQVPTTVLWGALDPLIPEAYAHRIGGTVKLLTDCSHWVPLEAPGRVAREVHQLHADGAKAV
jgi:pimeloyl-ACP methyl ester carboxylesterase